MEAQFRYAKDGVAFIMAGTSRPTLRSAAWVVALVLTFQGTGSAWAQGLDPSGSPPPGRPVSNTAAGTTSATDGADPPASFSGGSSATPTPPPVFDATSPPQVVIGPLDTMLESIFGPASVDDWQPLSLGTFFSEGWDRAYTKMPAGTNGAPKQVWLGAKDGIFARVNVTSFYYTNGMTANNGLLLTPGPWAPAKPMATGNEFIGADILYLPLNQRLELVITAPFITSNQTKAKGGYVSNFGDLTFEARFRLIDQRNFSMTASIYERTPTGQAVNGNDINFVTPEISAWWNFAPNWVVRGGTGINIDTGRKSATDVYFNNLALGRYLTTKEARFFKELVVYTSVSTLSDVAGRKDFISDVYIQPGLRFGLDKDQKWYVMGSIIAPVSGPHPYAWQPSAALIWNY
jgi:hypothetical protein